MAVTVVRAGFLTTVQDLGRPGSRQFGVSLGGALDSHALRVANLLVGNNETAAGLEISSGGVRLAVRGERLVAWCGGEFEVHIGDIPLAPGRPAVLGAGEELIFEHPKRGCRSWLAISGGIGVPVVLGSRSTDLRGQFGGWNGRALRDGDELPLGDIPDRAKILLSALREQKVVRWTAPHEWVSPARPEPVLRFTRGADWQRFDVSSVEDFTSGVFAVSPQSDRMGVRLNGPELRRSDQSDLLSEAVAPGTIQVPPNGQPILLLGDCQTIGGYPKLAHVISIDLSVAAQLRPADHVWFTEVPLATAHQLLFEREEKLAQFRHGIETHFA